MLTTGDFARAGSPIMRLVQIDPLKLSFSVAEKDIAAMKEGQDVIFTADSYQGREFTGKLSTIYPSLDERSRTLQAEALVPNPFFELKPGLFTRVKLYTGASRESVVIPVTSILYEGTKVRVFLMDKDQAHERFITIGGKYGDMVEVLEGLKGGEQLIVVGQNNLVDKVKVHAVR
jgi:membrane fusion protein (multidrug efflux system)